jgi:transcriptional regulator with XRE-family HTH domain
MTNQEEYKRLIESLKGVVRSKGWTYAQIAKKLKLSEPTIKRIFQGIPCNVDKITRICDLLEVSLLDLVHLTSDKAPEKYWFTKEQEEFFARHFDYYAFLFSLYYNLEGGLKGLQKAWSISDEESFVYLRRLEKLGLLEVLPGNDYKFKVSGQLNVDDDGVIFNSDFIVREFLEFAQEVAKHRLKKGYSFRVAGLQLSFETYEKFLVELKALQERYYDISAREEALTPPNKRRFYGMCIAIGPYDPTDMKKFWDYGRKQKQERGAK